MSHRGGPRVRVLFVCMGNICRSPTAEGVFRALMEAQGLADLVEIDSAGTGGWHAGAPPDRRSQAAARKRGIDIGGQRARQVTVRDLVGPGAFDFVVAMDSSNLAHLESLADEGVAPLPGEGRASGRLRLLLRDFAPQAGVRDVPDPYFAAPGQTDGFDHVLDLVELGCRGLLEHIRVMLDDRAGGAGSSGDA